MEENETGWGEKIEKQNFNRRFIGRLIKNLAAQAKIEAVIS